MASECEPTKQRRYNPSMSRRTRKPPTTTTTTTTKISQDEDEKPQKRSSNDFQEPEKKRNNGVQEPQKKSNNGVQEPQKKSNNVFHRVSLKELMKEGNEEKDESGHEVENRTDQGNGDGMKPMEAAETAAEKHLPVVRKRGEGIEGAKMAGLVSRYAKVLNHLIKVKRSSKKKNAVQLLM